MIPVLFRSILAGDSGERTEWEATTCRHSREVWTEDFRTWLMNIPQEKLHKQTPSEERSGEQQLGCTGEQGLLAYNLMPWPNSKHKLFCHAGKWPPGSQRRRKMITCFVLKQQTGECVDFTTESSKSCSFFLSKQLFPCFYGQDVTGTRKHCCYSTFP